MNDPTLAAANLERGFYTCGSSVFFVNAGGEAFQLRSSEHPAMLRPARVPRCERAEETDDPVLALLAETADGLPGVFAEPGIYVCGGEMVISMSQQLFSLGDCSRRCSLSNAAVRLVGDELEAAEMRHAEAIKKIHKRLNAGRLLQVV
ncbi:MAG: hypothetical protein ACPG4T_21630 [Nannocystaceae bacterium]